jgi:segregation and condensation protein B
MTKGFDQGRTNFGRKGCRRARSFPSVLYHVPSGEGWKKARQRSQQRVAGPGAILDLEQVPNEVSGTPRESVPDDPVSRMKAVEAALFVAREPLSARRLAALADLADPTEARTIARCLNEHYDQEGYSFRIEEVAGGMQILSRPQFAGWLRRLELVPGETILSSSMLETLAIIAYRQPIPRAEIEAIRGVGSDEALRQLMHRDLVRIVGRSEELGRAYLYGTTRQFLQLFGLQSLDFLPRAQKIREAEAEIATRFSMLATVPAAGSEIGPEQGMTSTEKIPTE